MPPLRQRGVERTLVTVDNADHQGQLSLRRLLPHLATEGPGVVVVEPVQAHFLLVGDNRVEGVHAVEEASQMFSSPSTAYSSISASSSAVNSGRCNASTLSAS